MSNSNWDSKDFKPGPYIPPPLPPPTWEQRFNVHGEYGKHAAPAQQVLKYLAGQGFKLPKAHAEKILDAQARYEGALVGMGHGFFRKKLKELATLRVFRIAKGEKVDPAEIPDGEAEQARETMAIYEAKQGRRKVTEEVLPSIVAVLEATEKAVREEIERLHAEETDFCQQWGLDFTPSPLLKSLVAFDQLALGIALRVARNGSNNRGVYGSPRSLCAGIV